MKRPAAAMSATMAFQLSCYGGPSSEESYLGTPRVHAENANRVGVESH